MNLTETGSRQILLKLLDACKIVYRPAIQPAPVILAQMLGKGRVVHESVGDDQAPAGLEQSVGLTDEIALVEGIANAFHAVDSVELALRQTGIGITALDKAHLAGGCWDYPLADAPGSALTDLAPMPDGGLLTLERAFVNLFQPLIISLRRTRLPEQPGGTLAVETVARFDSSRGWMMDNFEGLAHHTGNRYFMVSDDNASMLQHTLLVYFEVLP